MNSAQLLSAIHDLFSRLPETYYLQLWKLQWMLYAFNHTDELEDEAVIAAAVEVGRTDWLTLGCSFGHSLTE
jgi:hypothetical protein